MSRFSRVACGTNRAELVGRMPTFHHASPPRALVCALAVTALMLGPLAQAHAEPNEHQDDAGSGEPTPSVPTPPAPSAPTATPDVDAPDQGQTIPPSLLLEPANPDTQQPRDRMA